jgi:eukaryotic-like serine/threonine-protein kinase
VGALPTGTRFGPYEILGVIGAGGMGDVYRARDTRLDRIVALKVSKEEFTPRFETEARATAALEHPHICRLYDVCHEDGVSFLVMEYVEGTPLAGPLPLDRVLVYAGQIAGALDEAHRKQIVHRDLKPSNILITKSGVKLLDFGLAKLGRGDTPLDDAALTRGITAAGTILGTLHYMSPEQLQGSPADARSDIFAFGLVLYEMLTGKRAFDGASAASIIAAILERPAPSVSEIAPSSLDRLIKRCLAKDPDERWQNARDIRAALDLIVEPSIPASAAHSATTAPSRSRLWPWVVAGAFAAGLVALSFVHFREAEPARTLSRFQIAVPEGTRVTAPIVSPDGRAVAFVATARNGASQIWLRHFDTLEMRPIPGTENATGNMFWSPDSGSIAFASDQKLKTIDLSGRGLKELADVADIGGGSWNDDDVILFSGFRSGVFRVSASGGVSKQLTTPSEGLHLGPRFLPDGDRFLYVVVKRDGNVARIATIDGDQVAEFPIERGSAVTYVPPSSGRGAYLLSNRAGTLIAQPVDDATFAPAGEPIVLADDLAVTAAPGQSPTFFTISSTGTLTYLAGDITHPTRLDWFDRSGRPQGTLWEEAVYNDVSLSPDDARVAVTRRDNVNDDIWIIDLARNVPARFTTHGAQDWHPVWSPDGQRLAFSSTRAIGGTTNSLFWKDTINVGEEQLVLKSNENERLNDWSPDGKLLLVSRTQGRDGLWTVPADQPIPLGEDRATVYLNSESFTETRGQFFPLADPDGHSWVAYTSNESGEYEIYVAPYPRSAKEERISTNGGTQPRWRRDGKELFYISPNLKMMAVPVTRNGRKLEFGMPAELFQTRISLGGTLAYRMLRYDVTRDGQRFLINTEPESAQAQSPSITVVLNWPALLKP